MRLGNLFRIIFAGLLMSGMAYAQVGTTGDLKGTVTDPTGAVVANCTVKATDVAKGTSRSTTTGSDGSYLMPGMPPAGYSVSVTKTGFAVEIAKNVFITIGQTTNVDFKLKISGVSEQVEVTAAPPVVETDRAAQANVIEQRYIEDLPINRRDYLSFTELAPGVADSTRMANDQDFRVKQTPQSGLSFYGSNGRGNSVTVDGGEANDDSGGVRLTVSQEAVQEFQINRTNYGADLSGGSGASINIVTKSGTNNLHGSLFAFFRNDGMDARDPFAVTQALAPGQTFNPAAPDVFGKAVKNGLDREQYGGSIGFPVIKDKSFLFMAFEGLRQNAQNSVPLMNNTSVFRPDNGQFSANNQISILTGLAAEGATPVPCLTGQPALPAATCAGILQNILTVNPAAGPLSGFLVNQFENNGGLFPYNTRQYLFSARYDHQFSEQNQAYLSYSFGHDNEQNPDVQALIGFSAGSTIKAFDHNIQGAWFHQYSPRTLNDLHIQWNYTDFNVIPNQQAEVGLAIPGFANLGTNIFLPSLTIMRRPEVGDNITLIRGHHTMKFGGDFIYRGNHTESHTFFPGRFVFGNLPGGVLSPCLQVPAACGLTPAALSQCQANANGTFPTPPAGTFCFPAVLNGMQSANLGLPQFYQQGFGSPNYSYPRPFSSAFWQDQWAIRPNFTLTFGVRYELDSQYGKLGTDPDNIAPRVSFAWDPFRDHKTAIRGGFGIFYSPIYGQIADVVQTLGLVNGNQQIAQVFVPLNNPGPINSATIFQTLFAQGKVQCTTATPGNAACITPADLTQFGINISHNGTAPLSVFFSGQPGYQNPYSMQGTFGIEREVASGLSVSASAVYVRTLHLPVAIDINDLRTAPFSTATSPFTGQQVTFQNWAAPQCGANPFLCFANPLVLQADQYSSAATALYYGGILEVKKRFSERFTLFGNYTWSRAADNSTDFNSDFGPFNNANLGGERALSTFDQRHKVVAAAVISGPRRGLLSGFQLSPIFKYNSGHPFNILAGGTDINGDRHSTNDRPLGFPRNSGLGPDYSDMDLRLTKAFRIAEHAQLTLMAEAFDLFNRTNFASVNNEVPTLNGFADVPVHLKGRFLNPATINSGGAPGAFTSALPRRQLQLGARMSW
jgi:hypothetical protein